MIFNKGAKAIQWREDRSIQQMLMEQLDVHKQKSKPSHLIQSTQMDHRSKWNTFIKQFLEGENLDLLGRVLRHDTRRSIKGKIDTGLHQN